MSLEEGANKLVGAAHMCLGNNDNSVSGHQQALSHCKTSYSGKEGSRSRGKHLRLMGQEGQGTRMVSNWIEL